MALRTRVCDLLGIEHPLACAPMAGGPSTPQLAAAVSAAGGLGLLAGSRLSPEQLERGVAAVRAATDRPFGVNFQLAVEDPPDGDLDSVQEHLDRYRRELGLPPGPRELRAAAAPLDEAIEHVLALGVPVLSTALGDPAPYVERAHAAGALVMAMVSTVAEARTAAAAGADVVVAQGAEAGGHRSNFALGPAGEVPLIGTMALVPAVVDAVEVLVLAAGGIADGRGLAAALALGADGALLGTRFLLARESGTDPAVRRRLIEADQADTVVSRAFTGRPARGLRNRMTEDARVGPPPLAWPLQRAAAADLYAEELRRGGTELRPLLAGQGVGALRDQEDAGDIVAALVADAEAALARLVSG